MFDSKKIIQLGLGIAAGMVAYHFIEKAMNKSSLLPETASAAGSRRFKTSAKGNYVNCICNGQGYRVAGTNCDSFNAQCDNLNNNKRS